MRATILSFNIPENKAGKLKFVCMKCGVLLKAVDTADFTQPIGALCGLADRIAGEAAAPFTDEMLVFCHMPDAQVNRFLTTARQLRLPQIALKAILTPTNVSWTANQLHDELTAERSAVMRGDTAEHEDSLSQPDG